MENAKENEGQPNPSALPNSESKTNNQRPLTTETNNSELNINDQQPHAGTLPNDDDDDHNNNNNNNNAQLNTTVAQQPPTETLLDNNNVQLTTASQQLQTEADAATPQPEAAPIHHDVTLTSTPKQHQTDDNEKLKSGSQPLQGSTPSPASLDADKTSLKPETETPEENKPKANKISGCESKACSMDGTTISTTHLETAKTAADAKTEPSEVPEHKSGHHASALPNQNNEPVTPYAESPSIKDELDKNRELENVRNKTEIATSKTNGNSSSQRSFLLDDDHDGNESGTEEEQWAFMKELENFFGERSMEFKPPKFYGEGLNCLKLWRAVMRLGGYDKVTSCKLWRQVGESFKPPKTCTTVSWTFRGFYEKALLDYERHKTCGGELTVPLASILEPRNVDNQVSGSGRARRDAAARAMQGWHSQRLLGNGEVGDPIIKDKNSVPPQKHEKQLKNLGLLKRKKPSDMEHAIKAARTKISMAQLDVEIVDLGPPADWVKINVQKTKDCFEVYALVPGLLREEVRVQSDPAGRLVISGEPEHPDNPWGVTPFRKVVSLPSRIDPHQTSAVVTLHGQLFVRVPFEQLD